MARNKDFLQQVQKKTSDLSTGSSGALNAVMQTIERLEHINQERAGSISEIDSYIADLMTERDRLEAESTADGVVIDNFSRLINRQT